MMPQRARAPRRGGERGGVDGPVDRLRGRVLPHAAGGQDRQHALAEPVRLLQVRVPGQDELVDAQLRVLLDPVGDLGVAADQGRAGPATDQAHPGPQVRVRSPGRRGGRRAVPASGAGPRTRWWPGPPGPCDHRLVDPVDQPVRLPPGLLGGVAGDDVQPDAEPDRAGPARRPGRRSSGASCATARGLAPGQVDVGVARRRPAGRGDDPPKYRSGTGSGSWASRAPSTRVLPSKSTVSPAHSRDTMSGTHRSARTGRPCRRSRRRPLLGRLAAGDHVEQQPARE